MERKNQFDEAIKGKIGELEDEPSARVWAGVQQNLGVVRPPVSYMWPIRMAAGVALICAAGLGYYLWQPSSANHAGMALREESRIKHIVIVPLDRANPGTYLAEGHQEDANPDAQAPRPVQHAPSFAQAPQPKAIAPDSLKHIAPWNPAPDAPKENPIVEMREPAREELQVPKHPQEIVPFDQQEVRTAPAIASANTKRSYKLPNRDDLAPDNLKRKSGAILGAITNGANTFLGLDANYEEHNQDDTKLTAFNADFGLFKIKKVRTVKN